MKIAHIRGMELAVVLALLLCGCVGTKNTTDKTAVRTRESKPAKSLNPEDIKATITRVADWQLKNPVPYGPRHWAIAPLYDGLIDASLVTGDPKYMASVIRAGRRVEWEPGESIYHADEQAVGHAWLRLYLIDPNKDPALLRPFKERFDEILKNRITETLSFTNKPATVGVEYTDRWTWADALYMAPPTLGKLAQATGDKRYLEFVDTEFKSAYDALCDPREKLFYRDARFINLRSPNNKKVFWSRANGWVYAGLALLLETMPQDYPNRKFYVDLFRQMSPALLKAQQPDGFWYANLKDPKHIPIGETSGSALFVFGMAWGIQHGLLDRKKYWPAVELGWNALTTRIEPNGAVEFVQPIGAKPEAFDPDSRQAFGTGALLMAGSEILRAMNAGSKVESSKIFTQALPLVPAAPDLSRNRKKERAATGADDRAYCVKVLTRIAEPVLDALSKGELKKRMPIHDWEKKRQAWTHYEAFARTLAGIAPWLELGPDDTPEGKLRARFIDLARKSLINATDPKSPDYMNFGQVPDQPLVESAYLSYALFAAPKQLWESLNEGQRKNVLDALRISSRIKLTHNNNWCLFPAMIQAAFWQFEGKADPEPIETAVQKFQDWYLGDGTYSDGEIFKWDYYNSFAIHPFLLEVLRVAEDKGHPIARYLPVTLERARRHTEIQERTISPEGTFPVIGRSEAYRFGVFFHLSYMALHNELPPAVKPAAVRGAITAVVRRMVEAPGTFDEQGWLRLGVVGYQPGVREDYNATGSLYMCLLGLVNLGMPPEDPFWNDPPTQWTQQRIWSGEDIPRDRALEDRKKSDAP